MFCSNCGKEIDDNARFCSFCGSPVKTNSQGQAEQENDNTQLISEPPKGSTKSQNTTGSGKITQSKILKISLAAIVAVVLLGAFFSVDMQTSRIIKNIDRYNIADYREEAEAAKEEYGKIFFLNVFAKGSALKDLKAVEEKAAAADRDIASYKTELDKMTGEKQDYDLDSSFSEYEEALNNCSQAINNREYENAKNLLDSAKDTLQRVIENDKVYVQNRLNEYERADWSTADVNDKKTYTDNKGKISALLSQGKFGEIKPLLSAIDHAAIMYLEPNNPIYVKVQQVDASNFPNVKLYTQFADVYGNVPANLSSNFFYIRKQNANAEYVRQKIAQVTQLNQLEALNINIVADVSGSMDGSPLREAKRLMNSFIESVQFSAGDKVELTSFSTGVYLVQKFTDNASMLESCVNSLTTGDMTSLYDALYTAVTRTAAQGGAKCVIAFTDGKDNNSNCSPEQVITLAQRYSIPIFIIGVGSFDSSNISYIASQTGGIYYSVASVSDIKDIYDQIYKQEKELYMIEFCDESGMDIKDAANIIVGYHSTEFGGETAYSYTPNILLSVDGAAMYTDGPEAVVEGYIKGWDDAISQSDFSYIAPYMQTGSSLYVMQEKYIKNNYSEQLDSYEIVSNEPIDENSCYITTRETFYVLTPNTPLSLLTQQCKYKVQKINGEWKMTDFADRKEVSKIKQ